MRAVRLGPHDREQRTRPQGRPWLLAVLVLALLWPALLAPAHRHPGSAGPLTLTTPAQTQDRGAARGPHDGDACAVCRELLNTAAYLTPGAALIVAVMLAHLPLAPAGTIAWRLPGPAAAWRSRAPPPPALN